MQSQPVQSITGGLCAVSAGAEHHGRTVCGLSRCRASREDCVQSQPVQIITGGLCAVSAGAEHHGRTVCSSGRAEHHGRTVCDLSRCRSSREDCVRSQPVQSITGGLCAVSAGAEHHGRTVCGLRSAWNSCQPVSDFATFGLFSAASRQKSKKSGKKAARK